MSLCNYCKNAERDYFEFYGTNQKHWFVSGCKIGKDPGEELKDSEDCEGFEDIEYENRYS